MTISVHHEDVTERRNMLFRCMLKQIENGHLKASNEIKETFDLILSYKVIAKWTFVSRDKTIRIFA
jgi:hypothetical protein